MENLSFSLNAVAPMFLMGLIGYILKRLNFVPDEVFNGASKIAYKIFLPSLLFLNAYNSDFTVTDWGIFSFCIALLLVNFGLYVLFIPLIEKRNENRAAMIQALFRGNTALYGIPLVKSFLPAESMSGVLVLLCVVIIIYNVLSVITMEVFSAHKAKFGTVVKNVLTNPLIIMAALGIILSISGLTLPKFIETTAETLGNAATPLGFLCVGASFSLKTGREHAKAIITVTAQRLLIGPLVALLVGTLIFGASPVLAASVLVVFATPTAISSFAISQASGANDKLAADLIVYTTFFSVLTLFLFIFSLKSLAVI